jgi:uncharacterized protein (TIGR04255 family)
MTATDSPFPPSPRVIYTPNPLSEVVCQLKFSPILKIETELPASFQERIRPEFPMLRDRSLAAGFDLPPDIPGPVAAILKGAISGLGRRAAFDFVSEDEKWTLSLTKEFMALSTTSYETWESFKTRLETPFRSLIDCYSPALTRVGLRYQNLIRPAALGMSDRPWSDLLAPQITGMLGVPTVSQAIRQSFAQYTIDLSNPGGFVAIRAGLASVSPQETAAFLIDNDFFVERSTKSAHVHTILDALNHHSGRLFRWCITEQLHTAMAPRLV